MKLLPAACLALAFAPLASASVSLFDTAASVDDFNVRISYNGSSDAADYTATGGLSGSGAVQMNGSYESQAWIAQNGFSFAPGTTYTVSAYLRADSYAGIGFTYSPTAATGALYPDNSILHGVNANTPQYFDLNSTGTSYAADEGFWDSTGALQNTVSSPAAFAVGDWVYMSLAITYNGTDYTADYAARLSDSNGNLGAAIIEGSQNFSNSGLSSSGTLYPFFYFDGGFGTPTVDNFAASVPEPRTYAALAGLTALAVVGLRRRRA
ncbi:MAG: PEP-CTERM sorting domain-containing protein [Verrucomicrobiota bacterium JB022]|nr:PEP-CTERM sorting domain-containing protein [Verrucomicrobiota bacterium JB022]